MSNNGMSVEWDDEDITIRLTYRGREWTIILPRDNYEWADSIPFKNDEADLFSWMDSNTLYSGYRDEM
jgi:hypothetical protein